MNRLSQGSCLVLLAVLNGVRGIAQSTEVESSVLVRRIDAIPKEVALADGSLHVINLYKIQASILLRSQTRSPSDIVDQLVRDVYTPYSSFWQGYLGDEATFRDWAENKLLATRHPIHSHLSAVLDLDLDGLFTQSSKWVYQASGRQPRGTWYVVFGPGWTDMGGLGKIGMVLDFTRQEQNRERSSSFCHMSSRIRQTRHGQTTQIKEPFFKGSSVKVSRVTQLTPGRLDAKLLLNAFSIPRRSGNGPWLMKTN